jgi:hypothetical protein
MSTCCSEDNGWAHNLLVKGMQGEEKNQLHSGAIKPPFCFCNTALTEIRVIKGHEKISTKIVTRGGTRMPTGPTDPQRHTPRRRTPDDAPSHEA